MFYKIKMLRDVEATAWTGDPLAIDQLGLCTFPAIDKHAVFLNTRKGLLRVERGDWVVKLPCGDKLILSELIFRKLFRPQEIVE